MRLIGLAVVLALSLFSASLAAEAQATRTPQIGYLGTGERDSGVRATGAVPRRLARSRTRIRAFSIAVRRSKSVSSSPRTSPP